MSSQPSKKPLDEETRKQKLRELANSDRPSAPIYREKFKRDYGEEP